MDRKCLCKQKHWERKVSFIYLFLKDLKKGIFTEGSIYLVIYNEIWVQMRGRARNQKQKVSEIVFNATGNKNVNLTIGNNNTTTLVNALLSSVETSDSEAR